MIDHDRIEELLAIDALDGLDPDDAVALAQARASHGAGCEECARLEREYGEVATALASTLDPVPVRSGLEEAVVARAVGGDRPPTATRERQDPWRRFALVAAAAALLAGGWILRGLTAPDDAGGPSVGFLAQAEILPFEATGGGHIAVIYRPDGRGGAFLLGSGLEKPSEGDVYELWVFEGDRPISAGCFSPEDGSAVTRVRHDVRNADLLAVTVEPDTCPEAPTTEPVFTADPTIA
jgi:anti-sigma-K factor RskA